MGWNRGNEVFNPVAEKVIELYKQNSLDSFVARSILSVLIKSLQNSDWDSENESLDDFSDVLYVVEAFADNDIFMDEDDEDEDEDDWDDEEDEEEDEEVVKEDK